MLQGKDIPDPTDAKVWGAAVVKGGGLGIYGDFFFGEYSRYGRTFTNELLGPVLGDVNSLAKIFSLAKEGKWTQSHTDLVTLIKRNIPGRNLFYLEPILGLFS